jgi:nicotinamidase-related amidase
MDGDGAISDSHGLAAERRARQCGTLVLARLVRLSNRLRTESSVNDAVFDKDHHVGIEGTPLTLALRDCGILSVAIVGIATEIGIEPTARHAADLCFIPVIIADACGAGDEAAA